jgi:nucleoside-diphosphate-sugar epimerase
VERGHRVCALTRRPQEPREGIEWIVGSLEDREVLEKLVIESDAIVHVAGVINAPDTAGFEAGNVRGTLAMLAAATAAGTRRFVHVSSLAAREPKLSQY